VVRSCIQSRQLHPPGLPDLGGWSYPIGWRLVRGVINHVFRERTNALRCREGLAALTDVMTQSWCSDRLNLLAVSPSLCPPPLDWTDRHHVCGFFNLPAGDSPELPPDGLLDFIAAGPPPVYFTFGSMMMESPDYVAAALELWRQTAARLGIRAIFQTPWPEQLSGAAGGQIFALRRSPYRQIFPLCSAIVHHGGAGTTHSSLLAGRPSVVVAHLADQFFWGQELERLGVAGRSRRRSSVTPDSLARSLASLLKDPDCTRRAEAIGAVMAREGGVERAVSLIEQRLSR
jgi:sterol 3beta-glucosyltransferase/vancomycin aglycone glucosyltransferase